MWFFSSWERKICLQSCANSQNDIYFHSNVQRSSHWHIFWPIYLQVERFAPFFTVLVEFYCVLTFYIHGTLMINCYSWTRTFADKWPSNPMSVSFEAPKVLYMSSSFWLLRVESRDFSYAEKERTACKDEQIHTMTTNFTQNGPRLSFWVKIVVILWICTALQAVLFFSAREKSHNSAPYSKN